MKRGGKPGNPHDWIDYNRAAQYFLNPQMNAGSAQEAQERCLEHLQAAIRDGSVRFKKPDSAYKAGMVHRIDLLELTEGKQWHATAGIPDTSRRKRSWFKRFKYWLQWFPKPWS